KRGLWRDRRRSGPCGGAGGDGGGVEGDCEGLSDPGVLRSPRAWLPAAGTGPRIDPSRSEDEKANSSRTGEIQGSNGSFYAGAAHWGQRARLLRDFFDDGGSYRDRPPAA